MKYNEKNFSITKVIVMEPGNTYYYFEVSGDSEQRLFEQYKGNTEMEILQLVYTPAVNTIIMEYIPFPFHAVATIRVEDQELQDILDKKIGDMEINDNYL